jgi:hypothetical protein
VAVAAVEAADAEPPPPVEGEPIYSRRGRARRRRRTMMTMNGGR